MSGRKKLLIVDDTPDNLTLLYKLLRADYEVIGAASGREALRLVPTAAPDLILLDVMMPEMSGFEVCRQLKCQDATRDIPVIFLTALSDETDEARGFQLGAVDYITKPFRPAILKTRIQTHLTLKSQRDSLTQANRELRSALLRVKELSGMLPICVSCKKIRNDQGYWDQLESYLSRHTDALFSHCFCPDCGKAELEKLSRVKPESFGSA
jgi:DNA-binding response OmpR family regulator